MRDYRKIAFLTLATGSLLLSSAGQAADVLVDSTEPTITFLDTPLLSSWAMIATDEHWIMADETNFTVPFTIASDVDADSSIVVDVEGDISLADDSVFIDRSENHLGIGTSAPVGELHVVGNNADGTTIRMEYPDTTNQIWDLGVGPDSFAIGRGNGLSTTVIGLSNDAPANSINATAVGVGIGALTPAAKLDVRGDINATFDGSSPKNLQQLLVMSANNTDSGKKSDAGFVVENARAEFSYAFRTLENFTRPEETVEIDGGFAISKVATGAQELVLINPSTNDPAQVELWLSSGASNVDGQWENASSRSYKKNINELSGADAMQAMRGLKSVSYQFKKDKGNNKMIGFIAEDIPELLATKTRKTVDSLRIVAVLTKAMQEQDKETAELKAKNTELTQRLAALEEFVTNLAAGDELLLRKGKEVALNK